MRFCFILIIVAATVASASNANPLNKIDAEENNVQGIIEDLIKAAFNKIVEILPDSINFDKLNFELPDNPVVVGYGNISDFQASGMKNMFISDLTVTNLTTMNMTMMLNTIDLGTFYNLDMELIQIVPLFGNGLANIHLKNLKLNIVATVQVKQFTRLSVKNVKIMFTIGDAIFDIHGILNNEDFSLIVDEVLDEEVAKIIDQNADLISKVLSPIAEILLNYFLSNMNKK